MNDIESDIREEKEPKSAKVDRSLNLIAEFEGGYAKDCFFAVGEFFKDQLDIKYVGLKEKIKKDGKVQYEMALDKTGKPIYKKNGKPKMKQKTRKVMKWTQSLYFCFSEGHVIYDTPDAYDKWSDALKKIKFRCEIIRSTPNQMNESNTENLEKIYEGKDGKWWAKKRDDNKNRICIGDSIEKYFNGSVTFVISKTNIEKKEFEPIGQYHTTQFKFIEFLKTGIINGTHVEELLNS